MLSRFGEAYRSCVLCDTYSSLHRLHGIVALYIAFVVHLTAAVTAL
jgi:hypothetical protein